jgi:predicted lipoprotein with Yx(FWY)xxD motif
MSRTRDVVLVSLTTAGLVLTAACSSSDGSSNPPAVPSATGDAVSAQSTQLGTILVDGRGRTVYVFANDKTDESTCDAACAADWPPVAAPSTLPASLPGVTGELGTTTRSDGSDQLTVAGHPSTRSPGTRRPGRRTGRASRSTAACGPWSCRRASRTPTRRAQRRPHRARGTDDRYRGATRTSLPDRRGCPDRSDAGRPARTARRRPRPQGRQPGENRAGAPAVRRGSAGDVTSVPCTHPGRSSGERVAWGAGDPPGNSRIRTHAGWRDARSDQQPRGKSRHDTR